MTNSIKKIILACLLTISAASAFAEWTWVTKAENSISFYIDYKTIRKDGNLRKVWVVEDFAELSISGAKSSRYRNEYDCKAETVRYASFGKFTKSMGEGEQLASGGSDARWDDVPPGSIAETILKIVCAK